MSTEKHGYGDDTERERISREYLESIPKKIFSKKIREDDFIFKK